MKLGLILTGGSPAKELDLAKRADDAGFSSVYSCDFFSSNALTRVAAIAAVTKNIKVGTGIANSFTRSPMVLASGVQDIDAISGGRMILGLGTGLERMNVEWYGVEYGKPVTRVKELISLLRKVFANDGIGFGFEGENWQIKIPAYMRGKGARPDIPIWLAAVNRGMIKAAGTVADGMVGHPVHTRKWHREVTLPILAEATDASGRAADACPVYPHLITAINDNRDDAIMDAKRQIGFSFSVEHYHSILDIHGQRDVGVKCRSHLATYDFEAMAHCIPDELVDEIAVACTPDEAPDRLKQWADVTPEPMIFPASIGVAPDRQAQNMEAILSLPRKVAA